MDQAAETVLQVLGDVGLRQPAQLDALPEPFQPEVGGGQGQRVLRLHLVAPVGDDDEQGRLWQVAGQSLEHAARGLVDPVGVLDHQHHRPDVAGEAEDRLHVLGGDGQARTGARRARIEVPAGRRRGGLHARLDQRADARDQRGQVGADLAQDLDDQIAELPARDAGGELVEAFRERLVRAVLAGVAVAVADDDRAALGDPLGDDPPPELVDEHALARPGDPLHEDGRAPAGGGRPGRREQPLQLLDPPDEGQGRIGLPERRRCRQLVRTHARQRRVLAAVPARTMGLRSSPRTGTAARAWAGRAEAGADAAGLELEAIAHRFGALLPPVRSRAGGQRVKAGGKRHVIAR